MNELVIKIETNIASCNIETFKAQAEQYLANLHDSYETDEDFAILTSEVKELKELEDKTRQAIEAVLNGNKEVETIINEARGIAESFRQERLSRNKLVTDKSNEIKQDILDDAFNDIKTIVSNQDSQLITAIGAKFSPQEIKAKLSEAIKGKRTISSIQAAVNAEKNGIVVEITTEVSRINSRLRLFPKEFDYLFNDAVNLAASQATDDELTSEIQSRIDADKARQAEIEAKAEEEAKAKAEKERLEAQPVAKEEPKEQAKQADEEHKEEPVARVEPTNRSWTVVIKLKPCVSREQAIELAKAFKEQHVELIEAMKLTNEE
ncbi:hypothetical protein [Oligella urethralis]|uniref:hypothetical protein n=1 Tax=Oligella urethralis TaxID=90245 RepID=UPI00242B05C2|nr:hypothetical protein [Oligella urethralis]